MFKLTEIEAACGVTVEDVERVRRESYVSGGIVMVPKGTGPALGNAAARMATGRPMEFSHLSGGYPIYKQTGDVW